MATGQYDILDTIISPFFVLSSAIAVGLISFSIAGFDLAATAWSVSAQGYTTEITYATVISIVALLAVYANNRRDFSSMGPLEIWVVVATLALVVAPPFVPILNALLGSTVAGLAAVVVQAGGFYVLSYMG